MDSDKNQKKFWRRWRVGLIFVLLAFFVIQILKTGGFNRRASYYDEFTIWRPPRTLLVSDENYRATKSFITQRQGILIQQYQYPSSEGTEELIEREALRFISSSIYDSLAPYWLGTKFSKTGNTKYPGIGLVSPEHFVIQLFLDAGLQVKVDPEFNPKPIDLVEILLFDRNIFHYDNISMISFLQELNQKGDGLYLLALDSHIGFVSLQGGQRKFLHASPTNPFCVVKEDLENSKIIAQSKNRTLGSISGSSELIKVWLSNEPIKIDAAMIDITVLPLSDSIYPFANLQDQNPSLDH